MAAVSKITSIAESMSNDDGVGMIHEPDRSTPSRLVEIDRGAGIVTRISNVAASGKTAHMARPITVGDEISNKAAEAGTQAIRDNDRSRLGRTRTDAAGRITVEISGLLTRIMLVPVMVTMSCVSGCCGEGCQGDNCGEKYADSHRGIPVVVGGRERIGDEAAVSSGIWVTRETHNRQTGLGHLIAVRAD